MLNAYKEILSAIAIIITVVSFYPYIKSIFTGETKPHIFSWIIWGFTTCVVFLAQLADSGGAGAWPIGVSGVLTLYVAYLAYQKKSDITITKTDWFYFILALCSLPSWFFTADPLWAVIVLTTVDVLGFGPTIRKGYEKPFDEQMLFYLAFAIRNVIAIFALENYSVTTILFPAATGVACIIFIGTILLRRKALSRMTNQ